MKGQEPDFDKFKLPFEEQIEIKRRENLPQLDTLLNTTKKTCILNPKLSARWNELSSPSLCLPCLRS
jgi:hypothetical protein